MSNEAEVLVDIPAPVVSETARARRVLAEALNLPLGVETSEAVHRLRAQLACLEDAAREGSSR